MAKYQAKPIFRIWNPAPLTNPPINASRQGIRRFGTTANNPVNSSVCTLTDSICSAKPPASTLKVPAPIPTWLSPSRATLKTSVVRVIAAAISNGPRVSTPQYTRNLTINGRGRSTRQILLNVASMVLSSNSADTPKATTPTVPS